MLDCSVLEIQKLKEKLEKIALQKSWADVPDFNPMYACGGNFDDAFSGGREAGEIDLARELLTEFFGMNLVESYKRPED